MSTNVAKFNPPTHDTDNLGWAGMMGTNAYIDGQPINANPYALGTAQRQAWSGGWLRAQVQGWCDPDTASAAPGTKKAPPVEHYDYKRDRNGAIFAAVFLAALVLSCFWWAVAAHAAPTTGSDMVSMQLGGMDAVCGVKGNGADDEKVVREQAQELGMAPMDLANGQEAKFMAAFNAMLSGDPIVADHVYVYHGSDSTAIAILKDNQFCMMPPMRAKTFDKLADQAFGSGA